MKTLILAEHDHQTIKASTYHAISAAKILGAEVDLLIMGEHCENLAESASFLPHVQHVLLADHAVYAHQLAENCSLLVVNIAENYDYIIAGATTFAKNILPRVAGLLNVAMVSDVMTVVSSDTFIRPMYAGNILSTVRSNDKIKLLSIRTTAFPAVQITNEAQAQIKNLTIVIPNSHAHFESQQLTVSKRPELTSAKIVISGGRGLKSAENFLLLEPIADRLGAAIGASRAAVDAGFAPNDYQVGQTGKIVAPDLYIAVGISGAIQHLAGIKDSKVIVAINNDPDAPIFQVADYGLVGDLFKILPQLQQELDKESWIRKF
jgi:electron transfer flavoprotein alpha subunit